MWTYTQVNGRLEKDGELIATGYSGFGAGKNNPAMQNVPNIGPIPLGEYEIGPPHDTVTHGPHVMALTPSAGTNTFGRDGFLIHGDSKVSPGTASHGCIILPRVVREQISVSGEMRVQVV